MRRQLLDGAIAPDRPDAVVSGLPVDRAVSVAALPPGPACVAPEFPGAVAAGLERAASSSMTALSPPSLVSMRSSAWIGPYRSPSAAAARSARLLAVASRAAARRDGVTSIVSSKVGPSGVSGLSKIAVTASAPSVSSPSMLSSQPGTNSSITIGSRPTLPTSARMPRITRAAARTSVWSSARITPRLPLSDTGFTTHGKPSARAAAVSACSSASGTRIRKAGCATPCSAHARRCIALFAAASIASTGLCASPSSAASRAARGSIWLSTATTDSTRPIVPTSRCALAPGSSGSTCTTGCPPSGSAPSLPMTTSSASRWAALTKSGWPYAGIACSC